MSISATHTKCLGAQAMCVTVYEAPYAHQTQRSRLNNKKKQATHHMPLIFFVGPCKEEAAILVLCFRAAAQFAQNRPHKYGKSN